MAKVYKEQNQGQQYLTAGTLEAEKQDAFLQAHTSD